MPVVLYLLEENVCGAHARGASFPQSNLHVLNTIGGQIQTPAVTLILT